MLVEPRRDGHGFPIGGDLGRKPLMPYLGLRIRHERGLDIPQRTENRPLVCGGGLSGPRFFSVHFKANLAGIEDQPVDARADREIAARRAQKSRCVQALQTRNPGQRKVRIKIGLSDANAGVRGGNPAFGRADIRTAAQKIGGQTHRHVRDRRRNRLWGIQLGKQLFRRLTDQCTDSINGRAFIRLECRNSGFGIGDLRLRSQHIEARGQPCIELRAGQR